MPEPAQNELTVQSEKGTRSEPMCRDYQRVEQALHFLADKNKNCKPA